MTFERALSAAGVTIVPNKVRCGTGETHAAGVLKSIHQKHGADHILTVFACIAAAGERELWSETIGAVSDCLARRPDLSRRELEMAFRGIDLSGHRRLAVQLRPWPVRASLRILVDLDLSAMSSEKHVYRWRDPWT